MSIQSAERIKAENVASVIAVQGLSKRVISPDGELTLLHDIGFGVEKGESLAIVGTSGAGKSTLLGLLAGLDLPSDGRIEINGQDISALDEDGRARVRAKDMGFVFQQFQLLNNLTAIENVMLPLELSGRADASDVARAILERVGLAARLSHYPRQLSGGEQQRVAIARAFAPQPDILFADEPTGNLDQNTGQHIIELLFELNREKGTTLVLVTHDSVLAQRCGRRLHLEKGHLMAIDSGHAASA